MALQATDTTMTEEEYLKGELESEIKHEYIDGQVYAMTGVSRRHSTLASTFSLCFGNHMKGRPCKVHQSDFKVRVGTKYFYPDIVVECEEGGDDYYTESPVIIVEVLSPSTRIRDEITKLRAYQTIPSLIEYVLVSQDIVRVMVLKRINDDVWGSKIYALGDSILFESIGLTLSVEEIYDRVDNEDMQEYLRKKGEEQKTG